MRRNTEADFWARIDQSAGPDGCWLWTGSVDTNGYGQFGIGGSMKLVHRLAWQFTNGPIPPGDHYGTMCVCHRCDTPRCVNPAHLFLGSQTENMADCAAKKRGRGPQGTTHPLSKLTDDQVLNIRRQVKAGQAPKALARAYGVSSTLIYNIVKGKCWKHLPL